MLLQTLETHKSLFRGKPKAYKLMRSFQRNEPHGACAEKCSFGSPGFSASPDMLVNSLETHKNILQRKVCEVCCADKIRKPFNPYARLENDAACVDYALLQEA